jgi:hypothetical protein
MDILTFRETLLANDPPAGLPVHLKALWYDAKRDWDTAHKLIQDIDDKNASWIHAYLHRKEGDLGNARYWYNRAGKPTPDVSLEKEWEQIAAALLQVDKH